MSSQYWKNFGENVRSLREEAGMNQEQFAEKVFKEPLSDSLIGAWERAERKAKAENILEIADHFHKSLDALFGRNPKGGPIKKKK